MAKIRFSILLILLSLALPLYGQEDAPKIISRELHLNVDNDAMLIEHDRYYSSGIYFKYRRLMRKGSSFYKMFNKKDNLSKAIVSYDFVHRMYTSEDIDEVEEEKIDRPYAGWASLNIGLNYHFKKNSTLVFQYDLGWLGPATKTGDIQIWWHDVFNMKDPNGWGYQINNTIATNFSVLYQKRLLKVGKSLDFIGEQFAQFGTIRNNIRSGLTFRLGMIQDLDNSIYTFSKLGQEYKAVQDIPMEERIQEIYFYFNATFERVLYNTTIEGNFIGTPSHFTKEAEPWVFHHTWGFGRSGKWFDLRMAVVFRSTEVKGALKHAYMTITMVQRF